MIISEIREKVKKNVENLINRRDVIIPKPQKKFILEMVMGMLCSGSSNVTEIARHLHEETDLKHVLKRLGRMLLSDSLLSVSNTICLEESSKKVGSETILALDGGDISHQYGEKFEHLGKVRDGSAKDNLAKGYWLNQVCGYNPSTRETFPLSLDIYSTLEAGFKSANVECLSLVSQVVDRVGSMGLWVMDRGYDNGIILDSFLKRDLDFMVRMNTNRDLIFKEKSVNIQLLGNSINRRYKYNDNCRFGRLHVTLKINRKAYPVTLVCFKDKRNREPILWLCNGWIKNTKELKRRIRGYFHRWSVEESYRFEKQGFGIEKCKLLKFKRIKTMLGMTLLSWLVLARINGQNRLKEGVLIHAKMEKMRLKDRPKFNYYRLLRGIKKVFSGITELFRFRWKRKKKLEYLKTISQQKGLFSNLMMKPLGLEVGR